MLTSQQKEVLSEISPCDGFRYFSGADADSSHTAHFAMYAAGDGLIVVGLTGHGNVVDQEFDDLEDALRAFVLMSVERDDVNLALQRYHQRKDKT